MGILAELARNSREDEVRWRAAEGLAKLGKPALEVLVDLAANSKDDGVRFITAKGLAELGEIPIIYAIALSEPLGVMASWFFMDFSGAPQRAMG
jgi:HEAT repeat protein